jgi:hypothetical protein
VSPSRPLPNLRGGYGWAGEESSVEHESPDRDVLLASTRGLVTPQAAGNSNASRARRHRHGVKHMADGQPGLPATLEIDYPARELNRLTTAFRLFTAIPILIILALLSGATGGTKHALLPSGELVVLPTVLMLLVRQKYPRWWFDWNLAFVRFNIRVSAYLALFGDEYPSTDEDQAVHLAIPYPDAHELNRRLPLVKWFLAIPHYVVLAFLLVASVCCVIVAWFAILFTGRYPRSLFDFVVGVLRWSFRVTVYAFLLTTDRYPPFSVTA